MLPIDAVVPLLLFVALLLVLSLQVLAVSGHFPPEHRQAAFASTSGLLVLYGTMVMAALCLLTGLAAAWRLIPWYAAVIGGGGAILMAPLILRWFPDHFVDGWSSLLSFAAVALLLATLLLVLIAGR